jgi:selenocysteine lyase/cysteine desulfurase
VPHLEKLPRKEQASYANSNVRGAFATSQRSDEVIAEAHQAMADFLNAASRWGNQVIVGCGG